MPAIAVRHKIQTASFIWMQRSAYGINPRHADWRGGQAIMDISVIGRVAKQVALADIARIGITHAVNHRRISLQKHTFRQPATKDPGDFIPFLSQGSFFLHN